MNLLSLFLTGGFPCSDRPDRLIGKHYPAHPPLLNTRKSVPNLFFYNLKGLSSSRSSRFLQRRGWVRRSKFKRSTNPFIDQGIILVKDLPSFRMTDNGGGTTCILAPSAERSHR